MCSINEPWSCVLFGKYVERCLQTALSQTCVLIYPRFSTTGRSDVVLELFDLVATDSGAVKLVTLIKTTKGKTFFLSMERHQAEGEGAGGAAGAAGAPRAAEALDEESKAIWQQVGETLLRGDQLVAEQQLTVQQVQ